jgi:hypothetical protein
MMTRAAIVMLAAGAACAQVGPPMFGWMPDRSRVLPIYGVPGAAGVGPAIDAGRDLALIAISPRQDYVLATAPDTGEPLIIISGQATHLDGVTAGANQIVMSPRGTAAAFWFLSTSRFQIVSGLPGSPSVREIDAIVRGGPPVAFAVSDDGQWLAGAWPDGVYTFSPDGSASRLPVEPGVAALAFFNQRTDLALATSTRIISVTGIGGSAASLVLYDGQAFSSVGLALSFDNRRLVVADRGGAVLTIDLTTGAPTTVDCACTPEGVFGMGGSSFRLTSPASGAVKLFDAIENQTLVIPLVPRKPFDSRRSPTGTAHEKQASATPVSTVTISVTGAIGAAQQLPVSLSLASPYPSDITGTITLTFASSVGGDDQMIQFSNGSRSLSFTIPAGNTQAIFTPANPAVLTGTVAGTIILTAALSAAGVDITPSPQPTKTITTTANVPFIQTVSLVQGTGGFNVVVTGFATSREIISGLFHFAPATNTTVAQSDITVQLTSAFSAWYQNPASNAFGSEFTLTVPFTVTNGNAASVVAVTVTLTNSKGNSNSVSPQ